jgi:hypothetical protein
MDHYSTTIKWESQSEKTAFTSARKKEDGKVTMIAVDNDSVLRILKIQKSTSVRLLITLRRSKEHSNTPMTLLSTIIQAALASSN